MSENNLTTFPVRPCTVDVTTKALFHKWVEREKMVLHFHNVMHPDYMAYVKNYFEENGVVSENADVHIHHECCALVEFEDGMVKMVPAESIAFLDSKEKFRED